MARRKLWARRATGHALNFIAGFAFALAYIIRAPGNIIAAGLKWVGELANDAAEERLCHRERYRSAFQQRLQGRMPMN
jgi:hypothetical protein